MLSWDEIERRAAGIIERVASNFDVPWVMFQSWQNLLFMDWKVPFEAVRSRVPSHLEIDTYDGQAWITQIPMHMVDVHLRDLPPIPGTDVFPEINFRTYVKFGDERGIFFFSIDAASALGAWVAQHFFDLPYLDSAMSFAEADGQFTLKSDRPATPRANAAQFVGRYRPLGTPKPADPGSFDEWSTNRTNMYVQTRAGVVLRGHIQHPPWQLQQVEATIDVNTVPQALGFDIDACRPDRVGYSARTDTLCWPMLPIRV